LFTYHTEIFVFSGIFRFFFFSLFIILRNTFCLRIIQKSLFSQGYFDIQYVEDTNTSVAAKESWTLIRRNNLFLSFFRVSIYSPYELFRSFSCVSIYSLCKLFIVSEYFDIQYVEDTNALVAAKESRCLFSVCLCLKKRKSVCPYVFLLPAHSGSRNTYGHMDFYFP